MQLRGGNAHDLLLAEILEMLAVREKKLIRKKVRIEMNGAHLNIIIKRFLNNYVGSQWNR